MIWFTKCAVAATVGAHPDTPPLLLPTSPIRRAQGWERAALRPSLISGRGHVPRISLTGEVCLPHPLARSCCSSSRSSPWTWGWGAPSKDVETELKGIWASDGHVTTTAAQVCQSRLGYVTVKWTAQFKHFTLGLSRIRSKLNSNWQNWIQTHPLGKKCRYVGNIFNSLDFNHKNKAAKSILGSKEKREILTRRDVLLISPLPVPGKADRKVNPTTPSRPQREHFEKKTCVNFKITKLKLGVSHSLPPRAGDQEAILESVLTSFWPWNN